MKKFYLLLPCWMIFIFSTSLFSQSEFNHRALGVRYATPNNFGMIYKKQLQENKYWRLTGSSFSAGATIPPTSIGSVTNGNTLTTSLMISGTLGIENRRAVSDKINIISGFTVLARGYYAYSDQDTSSSYSAFFMPGIGYLIGCQYFINDNIHIDIEMLPMVTTIISTSNDNVNGNVSGFNSGLNLHGIFINLCYQFEKKEGTARKSRE